MAAARRCQRPQPPPQPSECGRALAPPSCRPVKPEGATDSSGSQGLVGHRRPAPGRPLGLPARSVAAAPQRLAPSQPLPSAPKRTLATGPKPEPRNQGVPPL